VPASARGEDRGNGSRIREDRFKETDVRRPGTEVFCVDRRICLRCLKTILTFFVDDSASTLPRCALSLPIADMIVSYSQVHLAMHATKFIMFVTLGCRRTRIVRIISIQVNVQVAYK